MARSRHLCRIAVVQTLFAYEFQKMKSAGEPTTRTDPETILKYVFEES